MKIFFFSLTLIALPVWSQGWGHRQAMLPWVQGRFAEAVENFNRMRPSVAPLMGEQFLEWEAEFEIERGRYGVAAALLREAKKVRTGDAQFEMVEKRQARLYWTVGQFADAEKTALNGRKWNGKDIQKLKISAPMSLVTIGEVYLARGKNAEGVTILAEACKRSKKDWSLNALEWIRAQDDIAVAALRTGQMAAAVESAEQAFTTAGHEWGATSIPAMDALDTIGLVRIAESKFQEADAALSLSRKFRETLYGPEHPKVADSYLHAGLLNMAQRANDAAIQFATQSLQIQKAASVGGPNGRWALALVAASAIFVEAGHADDAKECYRDALPVLERELGTDAPAFEAARMKYKQLMERSGNQ